MSPSTAEGSSSTIYSRLSRDRLADLHHLPLSDADRIDACGGIDFEAKLAENLFRLALCAAPVDRAKFRRKATEKQILSDSKMRSLRQLLVDYGDPELQHPIGRRRADDSCRL